MRYLFPAIIIVVVGLFIVTVDRDHPTGKTDPRDSIITALRAQLSADSFRYHTWAIPCCDTFTADSRHVAVYRKMHNVHSVKHRARHHRKHRRHHHRGRHHNKAVSHLVNIPIPRCEGDYRITTGRNETARILMGTMPLDTCTSRSTKPVTKGLVLKLMRPKLGSLLIHHRLRHKVNINHP